MACDVASTGVQIHGGLGFIEETGAAQFYRDARILPIYEGTNGIQSADLAFRKIMRDGGESLKALFKEFDIVLQALGEAKGDDLESIRDEFSSAYKALGAASQTLGALLKEDADYAAAVSVPYLNALATLTAGWMMARSALAANALLLTGEGDSSHLNDKIVTCRFYAENFLPQVIALSHTVQKASRTIVGASF